jgi:hypothetical protein
MTDTDDRLKIAVEQAKAKLAAMSEEERQAMWQAQRESFVRGMTTPCEHGVLDFEQCPQCRSPVDHVRASALEQAARIADAKSAEAAAEAKALRAIKDYARAKQLDTESAACAGIAAAIRALATATEGSGE